VGPRATRLPSRAHTRFPQFSRKEKARGWAHRRVSDALPGRNFRPRRRKTANCAGMLPSGRTHGDSAAGGSARRPRGHRVLLEPAGCREMTIRPRLRWGPSKPKRTVAPHPPPASVHPTGRPFSLAAGPLRGVPGCTSAASLSAPRACREPVAGHRLPSVGPPQRHDKALWAWALEKKKTLVYVRARPPGSISQCGGPPRSGAHHRGGRAKPRGAPAPSQARHRCPMLDLAPVGAGALSSSPAATVHPWGQPPA